MNVQTLPPGYKVAPWTPPEKIDGKMLADASAKLIDLLRIRTQPIGMRLFEDPADMEKIQGVRKPTEPNCCPGHVRYSFYRFNGTRYVLYRRYTVKV